MKENARRIGLMGGSFNPVHLGHLHLARQALCSGRVKKVLFLPSGNPPHKREGLADKMDRLSMVQLAVEGEEHMAVSREEIDRDGVIYTVDTLKRLHAAMPDTQFVYLIGADTLRVLHTWRRVDEVIGLCEFLVFMRPGEMEEEIRRLAHGWNARGTRMELLKTQTLDISSTQIRALAQRGGSLSGLVPPAVERYIRDTGLYGMGGEGCEAR